MSHNTIDYAAIIRAQGYRLTPQRELILDAVCEGGPHSTIDEIYSSVKKRSPSISLATVYRTLDFLCEIKLVVAAGIGGRTIVYEIAGEHPHHHLICRTCNGSMEISHDEVEGFFAQIKKSHNFTVDMDHLTLFGLCSFCQTQHNEDSKES